ncbi:MAG: anti-virulence regulator CigR family protein [Onishia taeanensis]|uniref:anti-virulence regulator CigR family protein n=1 Tax=Onishia taeanensis TaxID=284577 RepID=UPI003C7EA16D
MKRKGFFSALLLGAALGLVLASGSLLAKSDQGQGVGQSSWKAPGNGQGKEHRGQERGHGDGQQGQGLAGEGDRDRDESRERDRYEYHERERDQDGMWGPRIDEREIREIFRSRREYLEHDDRDSLPPGIRMNLERGKPLPPGIAKNFDERVRRELPYYDDYEWRRVGSDAVLVDPTNDLILEVIRDILR